MIDSVPLTCHLWWSRPDDVQEWHWELLDHTERLRAQSYRREVDRQRFVMGVALSRLAVSHLSGVTVDHVEISRRCADCSRPHGKPEFIGLDWHLSVAHSGDAVGIAISECGPVGLDVEKDDPSTQIPEEMVLTRTEKDWVDQIPLAQRHTALLRYWVRKEAVLKSTAEGLRRPMTSVEVSKPEDPARYLNSEDEATIVLSDIDAPDDHLASIAMQAKGDYLALTMHDAAQLLSRV